VRLCSLVYFIRSKDNKIACRSVRQDLEYVAEKPGLRSASPSFIWLDAESDEENGDCEGRKR
jgi:hypothetical protein